MKEENKKKSLMLLVIGVLVLLIIIAGATYAFFIAQTGEGQAFEINAQTASNDSLVFLMEDIDVTDPSGEEQTPKNIVDNHNRDDANPNTEIKIEANQQNFVERGNSIGDGVKATATLTANSTTNSATADYYVYVNIKSNELKYSSYKKVGVEPLVFKTEEEKAAVQEELTGYNPVPELIMVVKKGEDVYTGEIKGLTKTNITINDQEVQGYDITEKSGIIEIAKSTLTVTAPEGEVRELQSKSENWEIEIVLVNLSTDQELNTGKHVTGEVIIQKDEYVSDSQKNIEDTLLADAEPGTLLYHDSGLTNGAQDNSYRFSGPSESVKNYVCLDNKTVTGEPQECNNDDLYRIIGLFKNKDEQYEMKLIKADYTTSDMLGGAAEEEQTSAYKGNYSYSTSNYKNGSMQTSDIAAYYWTSSDNQKNLWKGSALNKYNLNTKFKDYLEKEKPGILAQIADHEWITAGNTGSNIYSVYVSEAYKNEITNPDGGTQAGYNKETDEKTKPTKIGLMYVSDYGYAAYPEAWTSKKLSVYNNTTIRNNNWMYMGLYEWTITRDADSSNNAFRVSSAGDVNDLSVSSSDVAVRPSFYLSSSTEIASGKGEKENPYRIAW